MDEALADLFRKSLDRDLEALVPAQKSSRKHPRNGAYHYYTRSSRKFCDVAHLDTDEESIVMHALAEETVIAIDDANSDGDEEAEDEFQASSSDGRSSTRSSTRTMLPVACL